jgi:hypothetical protein
MTQPYRGPSRWALTATTAIGVVLGLVVAVLTRDVILGVIAGTSTVAILVGLLRLWTGGGQRRGPPTKPLSHKASRLQR